MIEKDETDQELVRTLEFLSQTKNGKYSKVDLSSIQYARLKEIRLEIIIEESNYFFSMS